MTKVSSSTRKCFVCGKYSEHTILQSTNAMGSRDLDLRPPEMMRSTMSTWIQCCPVCGYCAPDLETGPAAASQVVGLQGYILQSRDPSFPKLARHFLCWSQIAEADGDYGSAAWAAVRAAWACDDARAEAAADRCRDRAVDLLGRSQREHPPREIDAENPAGGQEAFLADLLRRSGRFGEAAAVCEGGLAKNPESLVRQILAFQLSAALRQDRKCYTIGDVAGQTGA